MARILAIGVYLADRPNTAGHLMLELASSEHHDVTQRWVAIAPSGQGSYDLPQTEFIVTEPQPKFALLEMLAYGVEDFDWLLLCDDDIEIGPGFLDLLIDTSERFDFSLSQPARTADSFTDHPIVQIVPGLIARETRFVEIGPLTCIRKDAMPLLLPLDRIQGMGWGTDFVWPVRLQRAGLRMGIVDAAPLAHRLRPPVSAYKYEPALRDMHRTLAQEAHLSLDDAFVVLQAYA